MTNHLDEQFLDLYGPQPQFSDYKRGETVTYRLGNETHTGKIIWVVAAGQITVKGRKPLPTRYIIEPDHRTGFPDDIWQSDIVVDPRG